MDGEETFLFISNRRDRGPNSSVKGSRANHYSRAPAPLSISGMLENVDFRVNSISGSTTTPRRCGTIHGFHIVTLVLKSRIYDFVKWQLPPFETKVWISCPVHTDHNPLQESVVPNYNIQNGCRDPSRIKT